MTKQDLNFKPECIQASWHQDHRGYIYSIAGGAHNKTFEAENKINLSYNHTKITVSKKNVFRGFHTDKKTWKKCTCISGKIKVIIIDPENKSFTTHILSGENKNLILIPPGWYNGYASLSDNIYLYSLSYEGDYVDANEQATIKPKYSCYGLEQIKKDIGVEHVILSDRDS